MATIPMTNSQSTAGSGPQSQPPITNPAFRTFLSRLTSSIRQGFSQRRPWYELIDRTAMARPDNLTDAYSRIRKNFSYFKVNYITLLALVLAFSLLSHPFSLLVLLGLLAAWLFLYLFRPSDQPLVIFGRTFSDRETLGILVVLTGSGGLVFRRSGSCKLRIPLLPRQRGLFRCHCGCPCCCLTCVNNRFFQAARAYAFHLRF
ncbi:hypothetical protein V6Z12_A10G277100 [Gossypium hirsutum]